VAVHGGVPEALPAERDNDNFADLEYRVRLLSPRFRERYDEPVRE